MDIVMKTEARKTRCSKPKDGSQSSLRFVIVLPRLTLEIPLELPLPH